MKTALIILAALILAYFAFSAVKPSQKQKQQAVYYYPEANVYHDLSEGEYYFYHAEQKEWVGTKKITSGQEASLGEKIVLSQVSPAWKNNYQDRMIYSIGLFGNVNLLKNKYREDSLKLFSKMNSSPDNSTPARDSLSQVPEKPKKGLKKFFDKLFGKKDKD